MTILKLAITLFAILLVLISAKAQYPYTLFDKSKMEYPGDKIAQAAILLRKVELWGHVDKIAKIDSNFSKALNAPILISKATLKLYLKTNKISERQIGGNIDAAVSNITFLKKKVLARYFVIHDVSVPVQNSFPLNINDDSWPYNNPKKWTKKVTHTYVTRTGECQTVVDFSKGLRATKFELNVLGISSKGLFIHVELIQPRKYPPGNSVNAPTGPTPGFTDIQYEKLALLYICASVRKGEWLVPAFHGTIDEGLHDAHDDPQNFEIDSFTNEVLKLISLLKEK